MVAWKDILVKAVTAGLRSAAGSGNSGTRTKGRSGTTRRAGGTQRTGTQRAGAQHTGGQRTASPRTGTQRDTRGYLGEFAGQAKISYAPAQDGNADPGEVVWTWVPFEEDPTRGKDRPVLVIGRDGRRVLGLMLTSKDHDDDARQEQRYGREWMDVGTGEWDRQRRPSEVRLDRVMLFNPEGIRREGGVVGKAVFQNVAAALRDLHGWP